MIEYNARQEKIIKDILYVRGTEPAKVRKITLSGLASYFKAAKTFGPTSPVAKEALKSIREMIKIRNIEEKLLLFILDNIQYFDISATEEVVFKLDKLNTATYESYCNVLGEINAACADKDANRQLRPENGISSLLTNKRYKTMVLGLANTFEDIKEYLPFEEEFWEYIRPSVRLLHTNGEGASHECGVRFVHDNDNNVVGIPIVLVPKVVDYETAIEAIRVYKRAHDIYLCLGKPVSEIPITNANEEQMKYREDIENLASKKFR